jgi:Cu(I)/Ag(I) efflux system membrane protein CusA/SilA
MINRLIELSVRNRFIVIALYVALAMWGWWALGATPIDAIPDLSDNQVIVFTDWAGHSPQEVEDQVTYPLTVNLQGLAGVRVVRSQSAFGFSMVYVVFEDNVDLYFARARVLERMSLITKTLPAGVAPTLGPDATGVGHVFWYTLESPTLSLRDLRTLQDWFVRYQLNSVPGVAEVASVGGSVQQYQIDVDPNRLRTYNLALGAVVAAVRDSNLNVGGNVLESNGAWLIVRGVGLIASVDDLKRIAVGASNGVPVYIEQVADVRIGDAFRVASLVKGTHEAVGGVVVARSGVNTKSVIDAIKARIAQIQPGLPPDVRIVPFYDRSTLIEQSVDTLRHALLEEIALVTLAHVLFLMHLRSILIVTIPLPLAVLVSFLGMYYAGISSNIMSLAGIAIAIGVLVDAGIVVTENAFRYVEQRGVDPSDRRLVWETVLDSTRLVGRPVFFSMAIIVLAFVPVFALTGQEGKLFHPLAFTKTFAVLAATIISVTLVPVLCTILLGGRVHSEEANPVMRLLRRLYRPVLEGALSQRLLTISVAALLLVGALLVARGIGSEFMPPLNEGDLMFMPIADPSISLGEHEDRGNAERHPHDLSRGRVRRRKNRTGGHLDGSRAAQHDRDRGASEAAKPMAPRHDDRSAQSRNGACGADAGRVQHLDDADRQSDRHVDHRRAIGSRCEDLRQRSGCARRHRASRVRRRPAGAGSRQRLSGATDERPVPQHPDRPRCRRPLWDQRRRHSAGDRDGHWRNRADHDHRGPSALSSARPIRG